MKIMNFLAHGYFNVSVAYLLLYMYLLLVSVTIYSADAKGSIYR